MVLAGWSPAKTITLTGAVVGSDEEPVSGLMVMALSQRDTTDAMGNFALTGLAPGELTLELHGDKGVGRLKVQLADDTHIQVVYPVMTTVVLLHDNDLHFNFNYREAFAAQVNAFREQYKNVYLLNAGDIFVRHPDRWALPNDFSYYDRMCNFIVDTMNEVGYDVCTPGNHELDYIGDYTRDALAKARFPLLGANVRMDTEHLTPLEPYIVFETDNGLSLAILGLTRGRDDKPGVTLHDPIETARDHARLAQEHDLFIALTHLGLSLDRQLAEATPEIDVIIGGHSNHLLEEGELVNGVLLAMAGGPPARHQVVEGWPKYLGKIKVTFENDRIVDKTARVLTFVEAPALEMAP